MRFVEQSLLAEDVILPALAHTREKCLIEQRARKHVLTVPKDYVVLEEQAENVLQQRSKVGQKHAAVLLQLCEGRRLGPQLLPNAPIVRVILDPGTICRQRLESAPGGCFLDLFRR